MLRDWPRQQVKVWVTSSRLCLQDYHDPPTAAPSTDTDVPTLALFGLQTVYVVQVSCSLAPVVHQSLPASSQLTTAVWLQGSSYNDPGVFASDPTDGILSNVTVTGLSNFTSAQVCNLQSVALLECHNPTRHR